MYNRGYVSSSYAGAMVPPGVAGRVFGILGISFLFTALGAWFSTRIGMAGFPLGGFGGLILLFILQAVRNISPLNLIVLYLFTTLEGVLIGGILERYVQGGMGGAVADAAATTALVAIAAGGYGAITHRNLARLGHILVLCLIALIVASLIGLFVQLSGLSIIISVVGALIFTGLLAVDMQRVWRLPGASEGDTIILAVGIYLDLVNLFFFILQLVGLARNND